MIDATEVVDDRMGETVLEVALRGRLLLDCSLLNKGSAFSEQERRDFGLVGLLPSHVSTLEEQATRRYEEYLKKTTPLERLAGWERGPAGEIPLAEVVRRVQPTALIGVTGQPGLFTEDVIRTLARQVERPILMPLSNPTAQCEASPADLVAWTEGRALVATGSPFPAVAYQGRTIPISQCNNAYVFPGLGLGVIASGARRVTDEMFLAAARVLSDSVPPQKAFDTPLLPPLAEIRAISRRIALAVGLEAQRQGLARRTSLQEWEQLLDARQWEPRYRPMRPQRRPANRL